MWSDNETPVDYLGFQHLVTAVTAIVRSPDILPTTIGVFGDWGSGKSSLLQMATADLAKDEGTIVLTFNGWLFEGYEDAKVALMGTILDRIKAQIKDEQTTGKKAYECVVRLAKRVNLFRVLAFGAKYGLAFGLGGPAAVGVAATADGVSMATHLAQKVKDVDVDQVKSFIQDEAAEEVRNAVRDFRKDFEDLLKQTNITKLVVAIDDIDRCAPDTIIETLEAIKLFLFVQQTAFIIGADERLVKYAVRRNFPELPGERAEVGRDYLEKLIQFPIRVPPLGRGEMETYINVLFAQAAGLTTEQLNLVRECATKCDATSLLEVRFNHGIARTALGGLSPELDAQLTLAQTLAPILAGGLDGNPRQCKRFLNTFVIRQRMAKSRGITLKPSVLAKLMLLEHFRPESFRALSELQASQKGYPKQVAFLEKTAPAEEGAEVESTDVGAKEAATKPIVKKTTRKRPAIDTPREATTADMETDLFVQTCLSDVWFKTWLPSDPPLAREDLRPYFYFSRDKLGSLGGAAQRMSPVAQQVLVELFSESAAVRLRATQKAHDMNVEDATAIFGSLAERVRTEEDPGAENSALNRILDWTRNRLELFAQLISLLNDLPDTRFPPALAPRLRGLASDETQTTLVTRLLEKWSNSATNKRLREAAKMALTRKNK